MKFALFSLVVLATVLYASADGDYTHKFDNINVDQILTSDRLLGNYHNCLMDRGRCTPDAAELKKVLPDALATRCSKCSDKQKEITRKVIKYLVENKPEMWKELADKYDPEGKYRVSYEDEAKKSGIAIDKKN